MLKILQGSVVGIFVLVFVMGFVILFAFPDRLQGFIELVPALFGIYLSSVIPALIGRPLTEYVKAQAEKVRGQ